MESPDTIHGRMKEGAHLAGYSLQRAMENLRWLLEGSRYEQLSAGYSNVNDFLRDIQEAFALLNIKPEERKQIAELVKELQPKASQRAIADMVGVSEDTVARDLGKPRGARNLAIEEEKEQSNARNLAPPAIPPDDFDPIEQERRARQREEKKMERTIAAEATVKKMAENADGSDIAVNDGDWWRLGKHLLFVGDTSTQEFIGKLPTAAFAFADPPYGANKAEWDDSFYWEHDYLIDKADVVAVTPGIVSVFRFAKMTEMPYVWSIACWVNNGMTRGAIGFGNWIYTALFSHKSIYRQDQDFMQVSISNYSTQYTKHESRKPAEMLVKLITMYSDDGDYVIDPFLGSGTTLFAAEELKRICIGGELDRDYCKEIIGRWNKSSSDKAEKI